jgi:hypothetical protein
MTSRLTSHHILFIVMLVILSILLFILQPALNRVFAPAGGYVPVPDTPAYEDLSSYEPSTYGIPETIAGHTVLAVFTPENTACMGDDRYNIALQASQPDVDSFLRNNPSDSVHDELTRLGITNFTLMFVGPGQSKANLLEQHITIQRRMYGNPCIQLGGPIIVSPP